MKTDRTKEDLLEQLKKTPIVQVAANHAGVARSTYYRWIQEDKDFKQKAEEALSDGVKLINDLSESKLIASINEQNMTAIIYWLKNHHPAYRDKLEVSAKSENSEPLTEEQKAIIARALELSSITNQQENGQSKLPTTVTENPDGPTGKTGDNIQEPSVVL